MMLQITLETLSRFFGCFLLCCCLCFDDILSDVTLSCFGSRKREKPLRTAAPEKGRKNISVLTAYIAQFSGAFLYSLPLYSVPSFFSVVFIEFLASPLFLLFVVSSKRRCNKTAGKLTKCIENDALQENSYSPRREGWLLRMPKTDPLLADENTTLGTTGGMTVCCLQRNH